MKVRLYKRGHSAQAHHVLDQANYYRMAVRHNFDTVPFWHQQAQVEAGLLIGPGCEPVARRAQPMSPERQIDYLTRVMLAASGIGAVSGR